jgi:sialate O-acetylesterase
MITDWRKKFDLPEMSFLFVQLAAYFPHRDFTAVRNAQMAALKLKNTGYVVAIDIGDAHSPAQPIHPRRKQEVGRRLALAAQKVQYGKSSIVSTGPVFASMASANSTMVYVSFEPGTAAGLHQAGTADCSQVGSKLCCGESPFKILVETKGGGSYSNEQVWARVNYTIDGEKVALDIPSNVAVPLSVRYAWEAWPQCSLYNGVGGPDDHTGIAGTPWCWDGKGACPY